MKLEFQFFDDETECEFDDSKDVIEERVLKVRLDKWLWAARFFKTRALARAAVEAGKVFYDGERSKASREIELGAELHVRQGRFEKTVIVTGLSTRRRSTEEALQLFEETEKSKNNRVEQQAQQNLSWQGDNFNTYPNAQPNVSYPNAYPRSTRDNDTQTNPYPEQRERRTTRFLRRSFMRQPTPNAHPDTRSQYAQQRPRELEQDCDNYETLK